jgi:uncharacterized membrane protein YkoI
MLNSVVVQWASSKRQPRTQKMKRSFLIGFAAASFCLALSVALPISALARVSSETPGLPAAPAYSESETAAILQEIMVFARVPVFIREAITIAKKSTPGIRVIDVSFDGREDNLVYKIKAYRANETWNGTIDASTGKVVGDGTLTPVSSMDVNDKAALDASGTARLDLLDAVKIAEKSTAGKAVSAGLGKTDGKLSFMVVVIADGSLKEVSMAADREQNRIGLPTIGRTAKRNHAR